MTRYPARRTLPTDLARVLAAAHRDTGMSYRAVSRLIGIDHGYWRRLTLGERCPRRAVAEQIIEVLELDDDLAARLLEVAV